jgi:FHS family L-fucose permease-like MFS transporter
MSRQAVASLPFGTPEGAPPSSGKTKIEDKKVVGIATRSAPTSAGASAHQGQGNYQFALVALTSLFFMWGFITCLNDILVPHLKSVFQLNYTQSMLVQLCFFGAYFIVSLPAGALVKRISYKWASSSAS